MSDPFALDRARIRASFDAAAASYDEVAVLQREIRSRLLERLGEVKLDPAIVLDAGCGTGHAARAGTGEPGSSRWTSRRRCWVRRAANGPGSAARIWSARTPRLCPCRRDRWAWCSRT